MVDAAIPKPAPWSLGKERQKFKLTHYA